MTSFSNMPASLILAIVMATSSSSSHASDNRTDIKAKVENIALDYGIDSSTFSAIAKIESGYNPNAINRVSGACGVFQFLKATARQYGLMNCFHAEDNIRAAARLFLDNERSFINALGRKPTAGESYLLHQQGAGGGLKLLRNPNALAADLVGKKAVVQNGGKLNMSAAQFIRLWTSKL